MNTLDKIIEALDYDDDNEGEIVPSAEERIAKYDEITNKIFKLANDSPLARKSNAEILIDLLHQAFDYTGDNNRDIVQDGVFSLAEVEEELQVQHHYQYLIAYIARNQNMINNNIEEI